MWHDAPCFLRSVRGSAWKVGSSSDDRLPRRAPVSLPYAEEDEEAADEVEEDGSSVSSESVWCGDEVEEEDEAEETEDGCDN